MSRPNTSDDPQAPLLAGNRAPDGTEDDPQPGNQKIVIFNRSFSVFHLVAVIVGTLALIAIGISIAAIGMSSFTCCAELKVLSVEHRDGSHHKPKHGKHRIQESVCLTPECVQLSADIIRSIGDADPCENFYECSIYSLLYADSTDACGGWEKRVEIPSDRSRYGTIDQVSEENDRILRDIFSGPYPSTSPKRNLPDPTEAVDVQNFQKLQDAYDACLNETVIDKLGAKPLLSLLENVISKYAVDSLCHPMKFQTPHETFSDKNDKQHCSETKDSLTEVIEYLQSIGVGALFSLIVSVLILLFFTYLFL